MKMVIKTMLAGMMIEQMAFIYSISLFLHSSSFPSPSFILHHICYAISMLLQ